jgi:hypothetical protein
MPRTLFALFLIAHGLIHGAIYATPRDSAKPAPFDPGHSWALASVHVADHPARSASIALACTAGLAFALAGVVLLAGGSWWAPIAATAGDRRAAPEGSVVPPLARGRRPARPGRDRRGADRPAGAVLRARRHAERTSP